jgi:hypothetical protein
MNLDEFRAYVEAQRKASTSEAIAKLVSATTEKENN